MAPKLLKHKSTDMEMILSDDVIIMRMMLLLLLFVLSFSRSTESRFSCLVVGEREFAHRLALPADWRWERQRS